MRSSIARARAWRGVRAAAAGPRRLSRRKAWPPEPMASRRQRRLGRSRRHGRGRGGTGVAASAARAARAAPAGTGSGGAGGAPPTPRAGRQPTDGTASATAVRETPPPAIARPARPALRPRCDRSTAIRWPIPPASSGPATAPPQALTLARPTPVAAPAPSRRWTSPSWPFTRSGGPLREEHHLGRLQRLHLHRCSPRLRHAAGGVANCRAWA